MSRVFISSMRLRMGLEQIVEKRQRYRSEFPFATSTLTQMVWCAIM